MKRPIEASPGFFRLSAVCLALFLGTLAIFGRAIGNDFINYDDPEYVTENAHVQGGLNWADLRWAFTSGEAANWHPVTWISHLVDWALFGSNPRGHHATSVIWHALNAVLVFLVFRRLTGAFWTSALCAALFAWHPLRVESVAWISERKDVLSGFFALLTLWLYAGYAARLRSLNASTDAAILAPALRAGPKSAGRWYALALAAYAIGLMCKPMLVTLPGVLLLLDFWPLKRLERGDPAAGHPKMGAGPWLEKIPFFILSAASCAATYMVQRNSGAVSLGQSLGARLANAAVSVARYLGKFFWPFNLAPLYPHPGSWPWGAVAGAVLLGAAITWLALRQRRQRPWLIVGWLWFLGMLIPVSGLVQVGMQSMADRYSYLPLLGVELALLWTVREWVSTSHARQIAAVAVLAILAGCAARTWGQIGLWANSATLFEHTIAVTKNNFMAYNNLGVFLEHQGRVDEAFANFQRAVEIEPDFDDANNNLGHLLEKKGRPRDAMVYLRRALQQNPALAGAHNNLGIALLDLGQSNDAVAQYQAALRLKPDYAEAHNNLGNALQNMPGRLNDAIAQYEEALRLNPGYAEAHYNLGAAWSATPGRLSDAIAQYQEALRLKPDLAEAHFYLAIALLKTPGRGDEAKMHLEAFLRFQPENEEARKILAMIQASQP